MGKVTADEAGVQKLRELAAALEEGYVKIEDNTQLLKSSFEEKKGLLGPNTATIEEIVETIDSAQKAGESSVMTVRDRLLIVADAIQEYIDMPVSMKSLDAGGGASKGGSDFEVESFCTNIGAMRDGLSLGAGDAGTKQLSGAHKDVRKDDGPGYESHHIPSAAVLKEFGIDTDEWPTIALQDEDHKDTDSYAGKQKKTLKSIFPDAPKMGTYKEESVKMAGEPGGLEQLIYNEILNIRKNHGDKYDGAIAKYLDEVEQYIKKHGIPKRPGKK